MAPLSDRLFEVNKAALFRIYRLFLTGVEVTQAIQHYGAAEHLTDAAIGVPTIRFAWSLTNPRGSVCTSPDAACLR